VFSLSLYIYHSVSNLYPLDFNVESEKNYFTTSSRHLRGDGPIKYFTQQKRNWRLRGVNVVFRIVGFNRCLPLVIKLPALVTYSRNYEMHYIYTIIQHNIWSFHDATRFLINSFTGFKTFVLQERELNVFQRSNFQTSLRCVVFRCAMYIKGLSSEHRANRTLV
jgi:hypothetical protein